MTAGAGSVRLSGYAQGRDNNFNLIRLLAALSVIFSHSVGVLGLPPEREMFFHRLGFSLAEMAVDVFFVTSGFLVTASLLNRKSAVAFAWARALRIFPALWVMLVVTVFGLGPLLTSLALTDYLASPVTHEYFLKCATLITGVRFGLPGIFESLPLQGEFNGSLWTLPIELRLYVYLAAGWLLLSLAPKLRPTAPLVIAPAALAVILAAVLSARLSRQPMNGADIRILMFIYGVTLYVLRDRIHISRAIMLALIACLAIASFNQTAFFVVYLLGLAPLVIHLAYIPGGRVRQFNRLGDYSYGVYIYAFPIQQTLATLIHPLSLGVMVALSSGSTLVVAVLSWRLIERRALAHKDVCAAATSRIFDLGLARIAGVWR